MTFRADLNITLKDRAGQGRSRLPLIFLSADGGAGHPWSCCWSVLLASSDSSAVLTVANCWVLHFSPGRVSIKSCAERGNFERCNQQSLGDSQWWQLGDLSSRFSLTLWRVFFWLLDGYSSHHVPHVSGGQQEHPARRGWAHWAVRGDF